ncbi:hypothetical protein D9M68_351800 [compost metagenome]
MAVLALAQGLAGEVQAYAAGQGVGHHQGRRCQPVGLHQRVHPALEVAVAGKHRGHGQVGLLDGLLDGVEQRSRVADAGGATVADQVEAKLVQVGRETGGLEVLGHHLGAGGQGGLDPGLAAEALFHRLLRQQAGGHHHTGVGGVGAGGDGGYDHGTIVQGETLAVVEGDQAIARSARALGLQLQTQQVVEGLGYLGQWHPVLRAPRAGQAGFDAGEVQRQAVGEQRLVTGLAPQALGLAVGLHQLHGFVRAARQAQVAQGNVVHREEAAGSAVFRSHVGDGGAVGQGQVGQAVAVELDEFPHHALLAQHLGDGEHQVGGGDAFAELAGELEADHLGNQHGHRLAEHRGLGLDAADAPAEHAEAVDHGGVRVGADQGVGEGVGQAVLVPGPHGAAEVLQVDLVADAGARRHHAEVVEGALAPAQEGVAFAVALHFDLDVLPEGGLGGEAVHHHRVVDHQVDRRQWVDPLRVTPGGGHGGAHGGQVDHRRYAGEVLHQHPRRAVLDLPLRAARAEPVGQGLEIGCTDGFVVLPAQQVFQQHFHRHGQPVDGAQALGGLGQAEVVVCLASDVEAAAAVQAIQGRHRDISFWPTRHGPAARTES